MVFLFGKEKITRRFMLDGERNVVGVEIVPPGHKAGIVLEDEDYTSQMIELVEASIKNPGGRSLPSGERKE